MKILVLSDSHGQSQRVETIVRKNLDAKVIIHLGDGADRDMKPIWDLPETQNKRIICVRGNCDTAYDLPTTSYDNIGGYRFYNTHGFRQHVKSGVEYLLEDARKHDRNVVLFGHTHIPYYQCFDGTYLFNPGAIAGSEAEYGVIDLDEDGIHFHFMRL